MPHQVLEELDGILVVQVRGLPSHSNVGRQNAISRIQSIQRVKKALLDTWLQQSLIYHRSLTKPLEVF